MGNKNVKQVKRIRSNEPVTYREFKNRCGMRANTGEAIPVKNISIDASLHDLCVEMRVTQSYHNSSSSPIETVFEFSMDSKENAITALEISVDGRVLKGIVKEKEEAADTYDDAIASGHGAALLEQKDADTFTLSLGSVPPNKSIDVSFTVVTELPTSNGVISWEVPEEIFPAGKYDRKGKVDIIWSSPLLALKSNHPKATVTFKKGESKGQVTWSYSNGDPLSIEIHPMESLEPSGLVEKFDESHAALVTFAPTWKDIDLDLVVPTSEIIFVIDRSGSMSGSRIESVRSTMHLFLRSLPESVRFNILGFGSSFEWLFPQPQPYNDQSLAAASQHIDRLDANLGGTELLRPLEAIFALPYDPEYPRQVFVLTDGQVDNPKQVVNRTSKEARTTRVFTLGIGSGVDQKLVEGLALAGKGTCDLIGSNDSESMEVKVMRQLQQALEPSIRNVSLDWGELKVSQAPWEIRPLFNGERLEVCAIIEDAKELSSHSVTLKGIGPEGDPLSYQVSLDFSKAREGRVMHSIAAKRIISDLEDKRGKLKGPEATQEIIRLALKYQLASSHTSFVAVEERKEAVEGEMVKVTLSPSTSIPSPPPVPMGGGIPPGLAVRRSNSSASAPMKKGKSNITRYKKEKKFDQREMQTNNPSLGLVISSSLADKSLSLVDDSLNLADESLSLDDDESLDDFAFSSPPPPPSGAPPPPSPFPQPSEEFRHQAPPSASPAPLKVSAPLVPNGFSSIQDIAKCQAANGSWTVESVAGLLKISASDLKDSNPLASKDDNAHLAWATAIALALLELKFASSKKEWQLMADKGRKWTKRTLKSLSETNDLAEDALKFAKKHCK